LHSKGQINPIGGKKAEQSRASIFKLPNVYATDPGRAPDKTKQWNLKVSAVVRIRTGEGIERVFRYDQEIL
jgi:hypothetical protein